MLRIFIVEDDKWYAEFLEYHLSLNPDYEVTVFQSGKDLLAQLNTVPDVITLDYSLPDIDGRKLLHQIHAHYPSLPVVIISGQEDIATAIEMLKDGAYHYLVKDDDTANHIWKIMTNLHEKKTLEKELDLLRSEVQQKYDFGHSIIGNSPAMKQVFLRMQKASRTSISVSIMGETGTGKELVAKAIHYNSKRRNHSFVAVNVAAIPSELIESELFGHEKGAFTGAANRRVGKFEEAHKGTLFLDEIGEMSLNMQAKLLRVLQERELVRIGGNKKVALDLQIITATHKDLAEEVKKGNFREDLYYRLIGLPIELPPLREREHDIILLAKHFIEQFASENELGIKRLSPDARKKLLEYAFPGNVRELKAVIELAVVMADGDLITDKDIVFQATKDALSNFLTHEMTLKDYNEQIITHFLQKYDNNVIQVAQKLAIGKSTIYRMLKERS